MARSNISLKLPIGQERDSGELRRIDEVERGLNCNCVCPGCKTPLVARKGEQKTQHFAHHRTPPDSPINCAESTLHKWAKSIVSKQTTWALKPEQYVPSQWRTVLGEVLVSHDESWSPFQGQGLVIDSAEEEFDFGDWKPDVLLEGHFNGKPAKIAVEINVSHPVDDGKLAKVKKTDINMLEIDLDPALMLDGELTESQLKTEVLDQANQVWLHAPLADKLKEDHEAEFQKNVAEPELQRQKKELHEFSQVLIGQQFKIPKCTLYGFNDQVTANSFRVLYNGKHLDLASGQELITEAKAYDVTHTELQSDRIRLYLKINANRTHPLDIIVRTHRCDFDDQLIPRRNTSTLLLVTNHGSAPESWLSMGALCWLYSRKREEVVKRLQNTLRDKQQAVTRQAKRAKEKRLATAERLSNDVLDLINKYNASEPEWSRSHAERFIKARELARCLGEGPYGGHGLMDRTHNDWVFGIPGHQWKTIIGAEMLLNSEFDGFIKTKSLYISLRKNHIRLHASLSALWKIEEGRDVFNRIVLERRIPVDLPTAGNALHDWLSHLSEVQPNLIATAGRHRRGFRWLPGQREKLLAEAGVG